MIRLHHVIHRQDRFMRDHSRGNTRQLTCVVIDGDTPLVLWVSVRELVPHMVSNRIRVPSNTNSKYMPVRNNTRRYVNMCWRRWRVAGVSAGRAK